MGLVFLEVVKVKAAVAKSPKIRLAPTLVFAVD